MFVSPFREQLSEVLKGQFDWILARLGGFLRAEHHADGSHATVTADAVITSNGVKEEGRAERMGEWTAFTPVWTGSTSDPEIGSGTLLGAYMRIAESVFFHIDLLLASDTLLASGRWLFDLPTRMDRAGSISPVMTSLVVDSGGTPYNGTAAWFQANAIVPYLDDGANQSDATHTFPVAWAGGDRLRISGFYKEE